MFRRLLEFIPGQNITKRFEKLCRTHKPIYNHKSVLTSFGIETSDDELDLPYIYWIPKMQKNPYKHRFIAGSSKCSTKPISILLTKLLTHIKQGLQKHCETAYSRSGINQMWILKNSKELFEHLKSPTFNQVTSIKSFDFFTLYTTIPHQKLKDRLTSIIRNAFIFRNGNRRYKYLVLGHEETYFVKEHSDSKNKYSEDDFIKILEFLVDNIFVVFAGKVFLQTVGIPMGTNCAPPLLADIFLYSYEADFIQSLLSTGKKQLASRFNLTYRYIDDVLSINNPEFENYLGQMYPLVLSRFCFVTNDYPLTKKSTRELCLEINWTNKNIPLSSLNMVYTRCMSRLISFVMA